MSFLLQRECLVSCLFFFFLSCERLCEVHKESCPQKRSSPLFLDVNSSPQKGKQKKQTTKTTNNNYQPNNKTMKIDKFGITADKSPPAPTCPTEQACAPSCISWGTSGKSQFLTTCQEGLKGHCPPIPSSLSFTPAESLCTAQVDSTQTRNIGQHWRSLSNFSS